MLTPRMKEQCIWRWRTVQNENIKQLMKKIMNEQINE